MAATPPEGLRIRRMEPGDYVGVARTMGAPRALAGTLQLPLPSLEYWRERLAKVDTESCSIVAEVPLAPNGHDIVANLALHPTNLHSLRRRHVAAIGMSVRDDWQGRGVGSALLATAIDRADNWMGILRIELTVFADNEAAIALYRRHGFVVEGTHRAYALRDGVYIDALAMARLHPRPPTLPPA
jgi:L-phenylalanine/L-methionine N-acetyltransferase